MKYKNVPIHEIKPYENNPRFHPVKQLEVITNSIKRFGFRGSILLDRNNVIVAGHARYEAAAVAGLTELPCEYADDLSEEEIAAYRILDNKIAAMSNDDDEKLRLELEKLPDFDFAPFNVDFSNLEVEQIKEGLCDEDEAPELKIEATTKLGDIWRLGDHRLMCGDATMIDDIEKLMNGEYADMVFTDPPYGVDFEQGKFISREKKGKDRKFDPIVNDDKKGDDLKNFIQSALNNAVIFSETCSIYVWSPPLLEGAAILQAIIDSGWHVQSQLIWNKTPFVIGRADYHWKHEICWYGYKGENHQWYGGRDKSTVWDCPKMQSCDLHPTMKPVQLAETACINSTLHDDIVLDLFGGSGSTLIACEKTNRKCFMMEIAPNYVDVIVKRWQKFTGKEAVLESNGKKFNELSPLV